MASTSALNSFLAQAATSSTSSGSGSSSSIQASNNQLTGNSFIQLLTAQLQAQDPFNPLDPSTFVTQLVQFNQLQQLIDINQTLTQAPAPTTSSTSGSSAIAAAAPAANSTANAINAAAQQASSLAAAGI